MTVRSDCVLIVHFEGVSSNWIVLEPTPRDEVIQRIGGEIYRRGSCRVTDEELVLIFDGAVEESKRFACLRDIALTYHWSFELPGRMTSVIFKDLP